MMFTAAGIGLWDCIGKRGVLYKVDTINQTCTCPSWFYGNKNCKHLRFFGVKKMEFEKPDLDIILEAVRALYYQTKYNNPDDKKRLMKLEVIMESIEKELGVQRL